MLPLLLALTQQPKLSLISPLHMPPKKPTTTDTPPVPLSGTGKFIYNSPSHYYTGEWQIVVPEPDPSDKKAKKVEPTEEELQQYRKRHGKGEYVCGGMRYNGAWQNDAMHGEGSLQFENGDVYEGQFQEGKIQGQGKFAFANGAWYQGEFQDNKMHGVGLYVTRDGRRFHGQFYNGIGPGLERELLEEEAPEILKERMRRVAEEQEAVAQE